MNWIIILFFIHLNEFGVKKVEQLAHGTIFTGRTILEKQDPKPSVSILTHEMMFLGVKIFHLSLTPFHVVLHTYIFPTP